MCLAIPGRIVSIHGDDSLSRVGRIDFSGVLKEASLACLPEARVGDYTIVHAGFALSLVDEAEAAKVFEYLRQIEELGDLQVPTNTVLPPPTVAQTRVPDRADEIPG